MHPTAIVERKAMAQERLRASLENLGKLLGINSDEINLNPASRDSDVADMLRVEAVANLVDVVLAKVKKRKNTPAPASVVDTAIEAPVTEVPVK